jgi:hypothetical protein
MIKVLNYYLKHGKFKTEREKGWLIVDKFEVY